MPPKKFIKPRTVNITECLFQTDDTVADNTVVEQPAQQKPNPYIQLDNREHQLIQLIPTVLPARPLHVADIWIGLSGEQPAQGGLLIERKTWADLEASVMDGRYREQRGRLLAYAQEVGARVAYIIERSKLRNFTQDTVSKFIARIQFVHGIVVFQTQGIQDTADLINSLAKTWEINGSTCFTAAESAQRAAEGIHVVKKENNQDPRLFALKVLCLCPGVSSTIAEAILGACNNSLHGVIKSSIKEIGAVKITTTTGKQRAIGTKIAERLHSLLNYNSTAITE